MMRPVAEMSSPARLLALVLVCALVLAGGWLWFADRDEGGAEGAEVVDDSSRSSWKTIEYQGVRVDIPASWQRSDMDDCEFQFEVWAPKDSTGCEWAGGMAFYGSSTFDPTHEPGIRRTESQDEPEWGGYTYAGDFAVYASDDARETVREVLQSAQ